MGNDESSSEHEDARREALEGEAEADKAGQGEPQTEGFRWAPGVTPVDVNDPFGVRDMARRISEQIANAAGGRLEELRRTIVEAAAPSLVRGWDASNLVEQLRQAASIGVTLPQYDFGIDLGRILNENRHSWIANIRVLLEHLQRLIPANLVELPPEDLLKVFEINDEDGTSLAWAPRTSIVMELIQASDLEARDTLLATHAAAISDDIDASLDAIALAEHQDLRAMLMEATAAIRAGLYRPAQAAAAAVLDPVVNIHMLAVLAYTGQTSKRDTRKHFSPIEVSSWDEATVEDMGLVLVGAGIKTAFGWWSRGKGPRSFNRNGSAHHADDGAYSPAHAVRAALIAHATLRWLDDAVAAERDGQGAT
ncbi:hypothetical protein [Streptomyces bungoensis]|uniref:hypothetical protein n=1 Tax=Streptomyces bungoensis TaxID=285568 RepID=UPI00342EB8FF